MKEGLTMPTKMPVFETERLVIREVDYCDVDDMYEYSCLPNVGPSAGWAPHTSRVETKLIIQSFMGKSKFGQLGVFAIIYKPDNKMVGTVELHSYTPKFKAELGYTVSPHYWGLGIATEASKELIHWGFNNLDLRRIECCTFLDNYQSLRVAEKLGFRFEGIKRNGYMLYNGKIKDVKCFGMTDDDYFNQ